MTINGSGTLNIDAKKNNGIKANDSLHITGGTYKITSVGDAFNVNDELNITGTTMTIEAEEDGVKVDNDDDTSVGTMYLAGPHRGRHHPHHLPPAQRRGPQPPGDLPGEHRLHRQHPGEQGGRHEPGHRRGDVGGRVDRKSVV